MAGILLFGGSFDPIHNGHVAACRSVADQLQAERVVLIPAANPPHKRERQLAPAAHRLAMCALAVADDARFEVSDWEVRQSGPNYTLLTVRHFREAHPAPTPLYWLIGMDSLADLATWYEIHELAALCTIVTAQRPGTPVPDLGPLERLLSGARIHEIRAHILVTPEVDVSATEVRARAGRAETITHLVPPAVADYIEMHGLYRTPQNGR